MSADNICASSVSHVVPEEAITLISGVTGAVEVEAPVARRLGRIVG